MFAQERMSRDPFLANMMPIMEFEKGGGGRYTPPPDYASQWSQAQTAYNNGTNAASQAAALVAGPNTSDKTAQLNSIVKQSVDELNSAINVANSVPDNAYTSVQTMFYSKGEAVNTLVNLKNNLERFISTPTNVLAPIPNTEIPPTPENTKIFIPVSLKPVFVPGLNVTPPPKPWVRQKTYFELLGEEIDRQVIAMRAINRSLGKPIEPAKPEFIWPTTSWQYEFWSKGYSQQEISWAENYQATQKLQEKTNGDFSLFKREVENALQDEILAGRIPNRIEQEITITNTPVPAVSPISAMDSVSIPVDLVNTLPVQPPQISDSGFQQIVGYNGVRRAVEPDPTPMIFPIYDLLPSLPKDPRDIPIPIRRGRRFISTPRPVPALPKQPGGGRTCGTGVVPSIGNWEDALIGAGATVDELDTIRRMMAMTKFRSNTDMVAAAKRMLQNLRWQVGGTTEPVVSPDPVRSVQTPAGEFLATVTIENDVAPASPVPLIYSAANPTNNIQGVKRTSMTRAASVRANALARRETTQARRGAVIRRR